MSRRDYIHMANYINNRLRIFDEQAEHDRHAGARQDEVLQLMYWAGDWFGEDNPNFDWARFKEACLEEVNL